MKLMTEEYWNIIRENPAKENWGRISREFNLSEVIGRFYQGIPR